MADKTTRKNKTTAADIAKAALGLGKKKDPEPEPESFVEPIPEVEVEPEPEPVEIERSLTEEGAVATKRPGDTQPIPDWRSQDFTYFPGCALDTKDHLGYDRGIGQMRIIGIPTEYVYQWENADPRKIATAKAQGWRFCLYDGGNGSGLSTRGFQGTDLFEKTADGRVLNGDIYLMWMPIRKHLAILEKQKEDAHLQNQKPVNDFMNDAYASGIRAFTEDDFGKQTYDDERAQKHIYN